jgi:hypothetical protein
MRKVMYVYGFLTIYHEGDKLIVEYGGNMGANIKSVNECLKHSFLPSIEEMREWYKGKYTEEGSPDYLYTFTIPDVVE